jgi:hypothetical protein
MSLRNYAIAVVVDGQIVSIPRRHLSLCEAVGFARGYNTTDGGPMAVVMRHPISRAISRAKVKSRSS